MAGNKTIGGLGAAAAAAEEDLIEVEQGGISKKMALAALLAFVLPAGLPDLAPIQEQIAEHTETISTLEDSFGSATSAAEAATAAEEARLAAVAARGQAEEIVQGATQVGIDAIDARNAAQAARDLAAAAQTAAESAQADAETAALASASSATASGASATSAAGSATTATNQANAAGTSASAAAASATVATTKASDASTSASAAASSATSAATQATNASNSAAAASTSATTASTQATNAANSATAASTSASAAAASQTAAGNSATSAAGSATTASTQATNAANSASAASTSASNASTSASQASTSASNAAGSASTAATQATNASNSATAAGNSASAASTSASTAATHATNAGNSASSAATQATNAANSASAAAGSASAASTSASAASTSATAAATSASSATTSANTATTQAGNASTSATAAATSATAAAGSASSASSSASLAASSSGAATLTGAALFPSDFVNGGEFYSDSFQFAPGTSSLASNAAFTYPTVSGVGKVAQNSTIAAATTDIANKGWTKVQSGRTYKTTGTIRQTVAGGASPTIQCFVIGLDSTGAYIASWQANASVTLNTWTSQSVTIDATTLLASGCVYVRGTVRFALATNTAAATVQWSQILFEDVTQATSAAGSATAAATSASSASTSASGAAASANSATTSANTATTQAGNASTSATSASSFAASASSSATSASNSAALSARLSTAALNRNPYMTPYSSATGAPDDWSSYSWTTTPDRVAGERTGTYAIRMYAVAAADSSILNQDYLDGLSNLSPGQLLSMEIDAKLVSGSLRGAVLYVQFFTSGSSFVSGATLDLYADKDISGAVRGAGTAGQVYRFVKPVAVPATASKARFFVGGNWDGLVQAGAVKTLDVYKALIRPIGSMEASVISSSGVVVDVAARIATAQFEAVTSVGGASAAIRLESKSIGGTASSAVALEANEIQLWNDTAGLRKKAMSVSGGDVIFYGNITAEAGIFLGTGIKWSPQLQMKDFQVTDGQAVSFGYDLGNTPLFDFKGNGLAPLSSGETYRLYADSASKTGFTARLRIVTPGSTTAYSLTTDTTPGTGPTRQIDKASNPDANTNVYTFRVQGSFTDVAFVTGGGGGGGWGGGGGQIP